MVAKIQQTDNYEMFEVSVFNRDVKRIGNLKESMKRNGYIPAYPLHCVRGGRGKLVVKAGHHRLESAKSLGLQVYYIVCEDGASIHELEKATNPWKFKDFILSHARAGSESHILISELHKKSGIAMSQITSMLSGGSANSHNSSDQAKDGNFVVKDIARTESVCDTVSRLRELGVKFATSQGMVGCLSNLTWVDEFEPDIFVHRVSVNLHMMIKQATIDQYLELIDRVYNHGAKMKVPIAFRAKEECRKRNPLKSSAKN